MLLIGDSWIRIQNYPQGSYTDLYKVENAPIFMNLSGAIRIKKKQ